MQGEIKIRIIDETRGKKVDGETKIDNSATNIENVETDPEQNSKIASNSRILAQVVNYASKAINSEATYEVNKYFQLKDDYVSQRDLNIAVNQIQKSANIISRSAVLAQTDPVLGLVTFIGEMALVGINAYQRIDAQQIALNINDNQLSYTRERAGYSLTSGSIGDNL